MEDYKYQERLVELDKEREFRFGEGKISAYASVMLGFSSILAVLAFRFPDLMTTQELRVRL